MTTKKNSVKKITTKKQTPSAKRTSVEKKPQTSFFSDFFRFGESYTSMVLGIVVVIAVAALLVSFAKTRVDGPKKMETDISSTSTAQLPTQVANEQGPTLVADENSIPTQPAAAPSPLTPAANTTAIPTQIAPPVTPTAVAKPVVPSAKTYTVQSGDTIWGIAEKVYGDGYQWTKIVAANRIENPGVIIAGTVLQLPANTTVSAPKMMNAPSTPNSTRTVYTVQPGDTLWAIAVREYGNGYKWVDIAKANNLTMPNLIHHGNALNIPR